MQTPRMLTTQEQHDLRNDARETSLEMKRLLSAAPPMPYALIESATASGNGAFHLYVVDARGRKIAALWGNADEKLALGEMIVKASGGSMDAIPVIAPVERKPGLAIKRLDEMRSRSAARAAAKK